MDIEVNATIIAMEELKIRMDVGIRTLSNRIAETVQKNARRQAPKGRVGNSTNPPGDLAASIIIDGPHYLNMNKVLTQVGPTVKYGRLRELGGVLVPKDYQFMHFFIDKREFFMKRVEQKDNPYLERGLQMSYSKMISQTRSTVRDVLRIP